MPPLRLTKAIIEKACEMRAVGGSDGACARHAGVSKQTFSRWLHFGEMLRDWIENGKTFNPPEVYRYWLQDALFIQEKLKRELEETGGILSKDHRAYLKLWDEITAATDVFVVECQQTLDRAKNADPAWALRGLRWFHPDEYRDAVEIKAEVTGRDGGPIEVNAHADAILSKLLPELADRDAENAPEPTE